jgi:nucleotide-binding universal stress UspA family protein
MFNKLLVPMDGSSCSLKAVDTAVELALCHESSVHLVHVIRDLSLPKEILDMMAAGEVTASRMQILSDSAEIILSRARAKFEAAGVTEVTSECVIGDPSIKILEVGAAQGADLIVLGQRGLAPHDRMLGGVARRILNISEISCLVVSGPEG